MPEDLKTGTTDGATGTTAPAADGSATASAGGSAGTDAEELRKKLQDAEEKARDLERKNAQLLSERGRSEELRREAAALRAGQGGGERATDRSAPADPFAQRIAEQQQIAAAFPPGTVEHANAQAAITSLQASAISMNRMGNFIATQKELLRLPDTKRLAVMEKLESGEYGSVQAALQAVEGVSSSEEVNRLRAELDELKKTVRNGGAAPREDVSTSTRQVDASTHRRNMSGGEYYRILEAGGAPARKLIADYDAGLVDVDFSR